MTAPSGCGPGEERCRVEYGGHALEDKILYCPSHAAAPLLVEALKGAPCGCDVFVDNSIKCSRCHALRAAGETA